jgi:hypothetical membrane protein
MTALTFIGFYVLVCVAALAIGIRFFRMTEAPNEHVSLDQAKRFGRVLMMAATAMIVFIAALWFHGDLKSVRIGG